MEKVKAQLKAAGQWLLKNWFRWIHLVVMAIGGMIGTSSAIAFTIVLGFLWAGIYFIGSRNGREWPIFKTNDKEDNS